MLELIKQQQQQQPQQTTLWLKIDLRLHSAAAPIYMLITAAEV